MAKTSTDWWNLAQLFERQTETLTDSDIKSILEMLDKADFEQLGDVTHTMCHAYEYGKMSNSACQKAGDIVLDKMIEKAEQSFYSNANRAIDGYWKSVKDNPELWDGLKSVLEKHPNYIFGQKYLGYMNGQTPEDEESLRRSYLDNPNMLFVTTTMVDVDGTLLQNGKLNNNLVEDLRRNYTIYTGGNPEKQREILIKSAIEGILEECPSLKKYTTDDLSQGFLFRYRARDLQERIECDEKTLTVFHDIASEGRAIRRSGKRTGVRFTFLGRLLHDKSFILPKEAFIQNNLCLAGGVIDDTQPQAQDIKSLYPAFLNRNEMSDAFASHTLGELEIPLERQISAAQVFEMWQQKQQQIESQRGHLQERQEYLAERKGEKVSSPLEATTHDSNSPTPSKPNGRGSGNGHSGNSDGR